MNVRAQPTAAPSTANEPSAGPGLSRPLARLPERLHHYAFVVRDQEANRAFFEDVLGIPLVATWCERAYNTIVGREVDYCHTFYTLADGGALAFFQFADADAHEALRALRPEMGQHFSMKVDRATYDELTQRIQAAGAPFRETDHGYCLSIYTATPDGLKIEFTIDPPDLAEINAARRADCHAELARWLAGDRRPNNTDRHGVTA